MSKFGTACPDFPPPGMNHINYELQVNDGDDKVGDTSTNSYLSQNNPY